MHLVNPPKFCLTIVLDFSWDDCNTQGKLETMVMQNSGGVNKVHYGLCENGELMFFIFCDFQHNRWDPTFFLRDVNEMVMICLQDQQRLLSNEVRNTCREVFSRLFWRFEVMGYLADFMFVLEVSLVPRVSLWPGLQVKVNPYLHRQVF